MMSSKALAKRARSHKPKLKLSAAAVLKDGAAGAAASLPAWVLLPNTHDQFVIEKLHSAPAGSLAVDRLVRNDPTLMRLLREALAEVYVQAAATRQMQTATRSQLRNAKSALLRLGQTLEHLEKAGSDGRDGLRMLLEGPRLDDEKGEKEQTQFAAVCWQVRLDIALPIQALEAAVAAQIEKPTVRGERKKRLRTLVDALAKWWIAGGGKSIAPYVRANRRDHGRAVVHGRSGWFLNLAVALLCGVDVFKVSEVEAAVTNVHEGQLISKVRRTSN